MKPVLALALVALLASAGPALAAKAAKSPAPEAKLTDAEQAAKIALQRSVAIEATIYGLVHGAIGYGRPTPDTHVVGDGVALLSYHSRGALRKHAYVKGLADARTELLKLEADAAKTGGHYFDKDVQSLHAVLFAQPTK